MILAALAMCMAGIVEIFRQEACEDKPIKQVISTYPIIVLFF
jgi:hypothetical protein